MQALSGMAKQQHNNTLGRVVRQRREALGWSQEALALAVGYTDRSTIAKIEEGIFEPSWSKVKRLAKVLGLSVEVFLDASER